MTGPQLHPDNNVPYGPDNYVDRGQAYRLVQSLPKDFDWGLIDRMEQSGMLEQLPAEQRSLLQRMKITGRYEQVRQGIASRDVIGGRDPNSGLPVPRGEAGPPTPGAREAWMGAVNNLPVMGPINILASALNRNPHSMEEFKQYIMEGQRDQNTFAQEFFHQFTAGIVPSPNVDPRLEPGFKAITKPVAATLSIGVQGALIVSGIGAVSGLPRAQLLLEQVPQRLRDIGVGVAAGGILDALRADGIPDDPSILDPSGKLAAKMVQQFPTLPPRLALAASGAFTGGFLSASFMGIGRGVQLGREVRLAQQATPEQILGMRKALEAVGVRTGADASSMSVIRQYARNLQKVSHNESLAGLLSETQSREQWALNQLYGSANLAQDSEEARYLTGLLRGQPGAVSVATKVTNPTRAQEAAQALGLKVDVIPINRSGAIASEDEAILAPAIRLADGRVYAGGGMHHGDLLMQAGKQDPNLFVNLERAHREGGEAGQAGFLTSNRRFVTRKEQIAILKSQKKVPGVRLAATSTDFAGEADYGKLPFGEFPQETPTYDLLISRPDYQYPAFTEVSRQTKRATAVTQQVAKSTSKDLVSKADNSLLVLADGAVVRGGFTTEELAQKIKVQAPVVNGVARPDLGLKEVGQYLHMVVDEGGSKLTISLPRRLTQEQFTALNSAANVRRFETVDILSMDGKTTTLKSPFGQQLQDAIANVIKPKAVTSKLTPDLVSQFKRTGVFKGQAAVLADGTPVTISHKAGLFYEITDPLTGTRLRAHPDRITVLPTSMEGEMNPGNFFYQYLAPDEQKAFAKFRLGVLGDLTTPIKKFSELARFANSRGFVAQQVEGKIQLARMTDSEVITVDNLKSAINYVRKNTAPIPDLTPDDARRVLGYTAPGFVLPQGTPPNFGELMPIHPDIVQRMLADNAGGRGPGLNVITPSRGFFLDLDKKHGTNFFPLFNNIKDRTRARGNFLASWYEGRGSEVLPKGVKPLKDIMELAGEGANPEAITGWMEAPSDAARAAMVVEGSVTRGEAAAGAELRKWYNELFTRFGIEADYVENYAPRLREALRKYGTADGRTINTYVMNDPLRPGKGADFWADNYRNGTLDVYDKDAFRMAMKYLREGSANRFVKEPIEQAAEMVSKLAQTNPHLAMPMGYFVQAVKGTEYWEQRVALSETVQTLIDNLPGTVPSKTVSNLADQLTNFFQASVYTGTMGMRPALAVRNVANSFMMSWPLYGGNKGRYLESLGIALTKHGVDEAIADGAIALGQGPRFAAEEMTEGLPKYYSQMADYSFRLYDASDQFTRVQTYWAARFKAQDALTEFMRKAPTTPTEKLEALKKSLVIDSGLAIQDPQVVDEFLRRAATSPEAAARYAGTQASDVVNFLYGRGMQPRWMRGVTGRMFGQFGTWSMWYVDYIRRTTTNLAKNAGQFAAASFLAKHALLNLAVLYAGRKAFDLDMGRWMVYPAVFYSGGPGFQIAAGMSTLATGLGAKVSDPEVDRYSQSKIDMGVQMISQSLPAMIPLFYAGRDAVKFATSDDPTVALGALIAGRPTDEHTMQHKLGLLMGAITPTFSTTSPVLDAIGNSAAAGTPRAVNMDELMASMSRPTPGAAASPSAGSPVGNNAPVPAPQPIASWAKSRTSQSRPGQKVPGQLPGEVISPAESRPIPQF